MGLQSTRKLISATFLITFFAISSLAHGNVLGDRLIIDINKTSYSQAQLEGYLLVRSLLLADDGRDTYRVCNGNNWQAALNAYTTDMIIEHETQRLGGFQAPENMIAAAKNVIRKKASEDANVTPTINRLGINDQNLQSLISAVLRIEAFRRSRLKLNATDNNGKNGENDQSWLEALRQRSAIRTFQGAENFLNITPNIDRAN